MILPPPGGFESQDNRAGGVFFKACGRQQPAGAEQAAAQSITGSPGTEEKFRAAT
jgi:hypothetical protein